MNRVRRTFLATAVAFALAACGGGDGGGADTPALHPTAAYRTLTLAPGTQCPAGGVQVDMGVDDNANGTLDTAEIDSTEYVCNGLDGTALAVSVEPDGLNCAAGGLKIETGADDDADGILDPAEVDLTRYVCDGAAGAPSPATVVRSTPVAVGDAICPRGGFILASGADDSGDGLLQDAEVDFAQHVCSGADGLDGTNGTTTLVNVVAEPSGANCAVGGVAIQAGQDVAPTNGGLDAGEVTSVRYVCNGAVGPTTLVRSTMIPAGNPICPAGGYLVASGVDDSRDGALQDPEVDASQYVCNGVDGTDGTNGTNGTNGTDGTDGISSLVRVLPEPVGGACTNGGVAIQSGSDVNPANGTLDAAEVTSVEYVCNGAGATAPQTVTTSPLLLAANGLVTFTGAIDTGAPRLPDGTRANFYRLSLPSGVADFSVIPAGAVEFHLFTSACLTQADFEDWAPCFVGAAPRMRLPAGDYVVMVKATSTSYLWGTTDYEAILRFTPGAAVGPATIAQHVQAGLDAVVAGAHSAKTDDFLTAIAHFDAAVALIGVETGAAPADVDRARLFGGLARVMSLLDPYSDLIPNNGLSDLGDLLDGFGLGGTDFMRSDLDRGLPNGVIDFTYETVCDYYGCREVRRDNGLKPFSPDSPRAQELQAFLRDRLAGDLTYALALLDQVTTAVSAQITDDGVVTQADYTDALFARAVARGMLAGIRIQQAYDLDFDVDELRANMEARDGNGDPIYEPGDFVDEHPFFGRLRSAASLPSARSDAILALQTWQDALTALKAEVDDQSDDLIVFTRTTCGWDPTWTYWTCTTTYNDPADIDQQISDVGQPLAALQAAGNYTFDAGTPGDPSDDVVVNAGAFFAGVDLRAKAPSTGAGIHGDRFGFFPEPTFGGVLVSSNVDWTTDFDADGAPDSFFPEFEAFFPAYFAAATFTSGVGYYYYDPGLGYSRWVWLNLTITFSSSGNAFTGFASDGVTSTPVSGTFSHSGKQLTLGFATPLTGGASTIVSDASRIERAWFDGVSTLYDGAGLPLSQTWSAWTRF
jgi:hypothetical protein